MTKSDRQALVDVIDREIAWHQAHRSDVPTDVADGFIRGMEHAKSLVLYMVGDGPHQRAAAAGDVTFGGAKGMTYRDK
jgi:hypothetical protein